MLVRIIKIVANTIKIISLRFFLIFISIDSFIVLFVGIFVYYWILLRSMLQIFIIQRIQWKKCIVRDEELFE